MYPPFHALASREGQEGLAGDALEGGPELESSRESPAGTSFPAQPIPPMTQSPRQRLQDHLGMESGQDLTWAVVSSKTQKTFWVLQRSCPSSSQPWDEDVPVWEQPCPGIPCVLGVSLHPVVPHGDVPAPSGPTGCPLSSTPCCHPQGHTLLQCPCLQTVRLEGQHSSKPWTGSRSGMQPGLIPASMDFGSCFPAAVSVAAVLWD